MSDSTTTRIPANKVASPSTGFIMVVAGWTRSGEPWGEPPIGVHWSQFLDAAGRQAFTTTYKSLEEARDAVDRLSISEANEDGYRPVFSLVSMGVFL